jgi:hypothetical protein
MQSSRQKRARSQAGEACEKLAKTCQVCEELAKT